MSAVTLADSKDRGTRAETDAAAARAGARSARFDSIDVFRGLTILLMVFVNDLGGPGHSDIVGVRPWLWHAMTPDTFYFADVIAPAFLFIMGMAIPFALGRRLDRGDPAGPIARHVLTRTASLWLIGIAMGNMRAARLTMRPLGGISPALWTFLLLLSFILIWNDYGRNVRMPRRLAAALRISGWILLAAMLIVFREGPGLTWLKPRWYVIGILGWAYLLACAAYVAFRNYPAGLMGTLGLMVLLSIGEKAGALAGVPALSGPRAVLNAGSLLGLHPSMTLAGVIVGALVLGNRGMRPGRRIAWMAAFGAGLCAGGFLTRPLWGAFKQAETPAWGLYSTGISVLVFAGLYWLMDVRGVRGWAGFLRPSGRNPLLPYFIHFMVHPALVVLGLHGINRYLHEGWPGAIRTMVVAVIIILFSNALTNRLGVRLKL